MQTYSISELAKEFTLTTRSIRHYEDVGLLSPRRNGSQRIYSSADRVHLQLIIRGKKIGLSLEEIKEILDMYQLPQGKRIQKKFLLEKLSQRKNQLLEQRNSIDEMLVELDDINTKLNQSNQ